MARKWQGDVSCQCRRSAMMRQGVTRTARCHHLSQLARWRRPGGNGTRRGMSHRSPRVLVVDDDSELRALLQRFLSEHGYAVRAVDGARQWTRRCNASRPT
jgi:PleD family two-component response regulator